ICANLFMSSFYNSFPTILAAISPFDRFYTFVTGVFDLTGIVYYITVIALFLYLSIQSLEKRRWS
ncbi:MAG: ABC transporter, partial [Oscillospiraceae bacterium]|nr:ABC transporter [Oscillospiraceae bacterium]